MRPARAAPLTGEELKRWFSGLSSAIALHFIAPAGTNGLNSRIQIDVMPNGFVRDARIEVSSGNPEFDSAVLKALYKATPLPLPQNPWATDSRVSLLFDPGLIGSGSPEPVGQDRYLRTFEDVQHVFDDSNDKFLADFRSHLAASGKIVIALTIAPDGGVTKCRIVESSFVDQDLLNTVLSDVKNLQFGARTGSDWSFDRYPIVYGGAPAASKN